MFPFARMVQYGNTAPAAGHVIKVQGSRSNQQNLMVLASNGNLWAIGSNNSGMFGTGNTTALSVWTLIATNVKNFWTDSVSAPGGIVLYVTNDDRWFSSGIVTPIGINASGTTVFTERTSNFSTVTYSDIKYLQLTYENICIVTNSGTVYTAGLNSDGRLGNGTTSFGTFTLRSDIGSTVQKARFSRVGSTFYVLKTDGTLSGSGTSGNGQLNGNATRSTFINLTTSVLDFWAGNLNYFVKKSDGFYACGSNQQGQNGNNTTSGFLSTPTLITAVGQPDYFYTTYGGFIMYTNSAAQFKYWGDNNQAKIGTGNSTAPLVPTVHDGVGLPTFSFVETMFNDGWFSNSSNAFLLSNTNQVYAAGVVGTHTPGRTINTARFSVLTLPTTL